MSVMLKCNGLFVAETLIKMSNLLLGVPDEVITAGYPTSWDINKVGGTPVSKQYNS